MQIFCVVYNINLDINSRLQNFYYFYGGEKKNSRIAYSLDSRVKWQINKYIQNYSLSICNQD